MSPALPMALGKHRKGPVPTHCKDGPGALNARKVTGALFRHKTLSGASFRKQEDIVTQGLSTLETTLSLWRGAHSCNLSRPVLLPPGCISNSVSLCESLQPPGRALASSLELRRCSEERDWDAQSPWTCAFSMLFNDFQCFFIIFQLFPQYRAR